MTADRKATILVVEDEVIIACEIKIKLEKLGFKVPVTVVTGEEAVLQAEALKPDLVLMDIVLKGKMDGIDAADEIRRRFDIPVVYLTAYTDVQMMERAKKTEPFGYLLKPFEQMELFSTIEMALHKHEVECRYREGMATLVASMEATINALASLVETKDPFTAGHQRRVAELASAIGRELALPDEELQGIRLASLIHDIGKIAVPAEILSKPGQLIPAEFEIVKTHPQAGYDVVKDIRFPWPIARMLQEHHERMDGTGYPRGLRGDEMLLESRIIAVADVVEAMVSHRPYRPAGDLEVALREIEENRGSKFDPDVAGACLMLFRKKGFAFVEK